MSQEHKVNCELFDGGSRCSCAEENHPLFIADYKGVRPLLPIIPVEQLRREWREEIERFPEMDALGSADWWINKMHEIIGSK